MLADVHHHTHLGVIDGKLVDAPGVLPLRPQRHLQVRRDGGHRRSVVSGELDLAPHAVLGHAGDQVQT